MAYESPTMSSTQPKPDLRQSCIDRPLSLHCSFLGRVAVSD